MIFINNQTLHLSGVFLLMLIGFNIPVKGAEGAHTSPPLIPALPQVESQVLTIVFDLDETIGYFRDDAADSVLRPGALETLYNLRQLPEIELVLWTAGTEGHARKAFTFINREYRRKYALPSDAPVHIFHHAIFRESGGGQWFRPGPGGNSAKDLRLLGRPLHRTLLIDNTPECLNNNRENSLWVRNFEADPDHGPDHTFEHIYIVIRHCLRAVTAQTPISYVLDTQLTPKKHVFPVFIEEDESPGATGTFRAVNDYPPQTDQREELREVQPMVSASTKAPQAKMATPVAIDSASAIGPTDSVQRSGDETPSHNPLIQIALVCNLPRQNESSLAEQQRARQSTQHLAHRSEIARIRSRIKAIQARLAAARTVARTPLHFSSQQRPSSQQRW